MAAEFAEATLKAFQTAADVEYLAKVDRAVLVPIVLTLGTLAISLPAKARLGFGGKLVAFWFLFNGAIIHIFLDGLVGLVHRMPVLSELYNVLDKRYHGHDPSVVLISALELFFMGPACLLLFYAILQNKSYRHPLQIIVCAVQVMGTYIFTGDEILVGFKDIPTDFEYTFTTDKVIFFWIFFVFANTLWVVLPTGLMLKSYYEISKAMKVSSSGKNKKD
eukprot:Opistho-2@28965